MQYTNSQTETIIYAIPLLATCRIDGNKWLSNSDIIQTVNISSSYLKAQSFQLHSHLRGPDKIEFVRF